MAKPLCKLSRIASKLLKISSLILTYLTAHLLLNQSLSVRSSVVFYKLQSEGLLIQNLNYTLSNDKREATRNSMIESAIEKLKRQATRVAKALGQKYSRFTVINIDTGLGERPPMPLYRNAAPALSMMSDVAVMPSAEPGTSTVSITVSATALLK